MEVELLLEDDDNPGTTRGTKLSTEQVIVFPFLSIVKFHRFSTHMNICVLSKAYQTIELLVFHRVVAHECILMLPRLFALLHFRSPPS